MRLVTKKARNVGKSLMLDKDTPKCSLCKRILKNINNYVVITQQNECSLITSSYFLCTNCAVVLRGHIKSITDK